MTRARSEFPCATTRTFLQARGLRRPHEHGGEELVDAPAAELLSRSARLGLAAGRERHVDPVGEAVLQVPLRLAVAQEEQIRHGAAIARGSPARQPSFGFARRPAGWYAG